MKETMLRFNLPTQAGCLVLLCLTATFLQGCAIHRSAQIQWDAEKQILISEDSQVKLRSIQTRTYEVTDKMKILRAAVATMQDLFFDIDVLDEELGIVSGKKLCIFDTGWGNAFTSDSGWEKHPTYYLYETDNLIAFNTNYLTWGPFDYRNDLARLTIIIRPKEEKTLLVRASLQFNIRAVESPETYQQFFTLLDKAIFLSNEM